MMLYEQVEKQEKEGHGGVKTAIGTCKFCGQTAACKALEGWGQEEIDELATEICRCQDARHYSFEKEAEGRIDGKIEMLFGAGNKEDGINNEVIAMLHEAAHLVYGGAMQSITVDIGNGIKGKISMTQKGNIKVVRTRTSTKAYEA